MGNMIVPHHKCTIVVSRNTINFSSLVTNYVILLVTNYVILLVTNYVIIQETYQQSFLYL